MPSALSHPAIPIAMALIAGRKRIPASLLAAGVFLSVIPDVDALGHHILPHGSMLDHRGLTHSLVFAAACALIGACCFGKMRRTAFVFLFISMASHGLLDAATNAGGGIAFFSPFYNERFFWPWRPIATSPLSVVRFFTVRFARVMSSELKWIWLPAVSAGVIGLAARRIWTRRA